jgi:hypothetical protein
MQIGLFLCLKDSMPIGSIDNWAQFGLGGVVIFALFVFLIYVVRLHKDERASWVDAYIQQTKMMDERQAETNAVIRDLVKVMSENNSRRRRYDDA